MSNLEMTFGTVEQKELTERIKKELEKFKIKGSL